MLVIPTCTLERKRVGSDESFRACRAPALPVSAICSRRVRLEPTMAISDIAKTPLRRMRIRRSEMSVNMNVSWNSAGPLNYSRGGRRRTENGSRSCQKPARVGNSEGLGSDHEAVARRQRVSCPVPRPGDVVERIVTERGAQYSRPVPISHVVRRTHITSPPPAANGLRRRPRSRCICSPTPDSEGASRS